MALPSASVRVQIKEGGGVAVTASGCLLACEWQVSLFSEFSIKHLSVFVIGFIYISII